MKARTKKAAIIGRPTEEETQRIIVEGLRWQGYQVQITTRRRKRCWKCGTWPQAGDGVSRGLADLLVRRQSWAPGLWLALEVKRPGAAVCYSSREQQAAVYNRQILIVRCLEEALEHLQKVEI